VSYPIVKRRIALSHVMVYFSAHPDTRQHEAAMRQREVTYRQHEVTMRQRETAFFKCSRFLT
jgi:hypothetical protein